MNLTPLRLHHAIGPGLSRVVRIGRGERVTTVAQSSFGTIGHSAGVWMEISPWITAAMVAKDSLASYAPLRLRNIAPKRRGVEGKQSENIPFGGSEVFRP